MTSDLRPSDGTPLLIDGKLVGGSAGVFATTSPTTGERIGWAADGSAEDMGAAIAAARTAFDETGWSTDPGLRARCVRQLRDAMLDHIEQLREITIAEAGAPRLLTSGPHLEGPVHDLGWFAELAENYAWRTDLPIAEPLGMRTARVLRREAVGVVGAITPWNFPHQINLAKLGPALAAGNTVVLKPAPDTPWCAAALGILAAEHTDIPPGVLNVVTSSDHLVGALLAEDPRVDLVSFTGSTRTGKSVMAAAANTVKKVFLELGGKSAFVVLEDADLRAACSMAAFSVCVHAGQGCALSTRLLVPRSKYEEAVAITAETMGGVRPGDPNDAGTVCGPLISERQRQRVESYLELARRDGGEILVGGGRPAGRDEGWFVEPTLITGLPTTSAVVREEIFGPVLVVLPYDDDADAVRIANDSPYGLSGAVWGTDPERVDKVVSAIRTGTLSVNGGTWYSVDAPFGGYKQSGIGREMGVAGFEEYLETKLVAYPA
ncbi:aldehyde dehydrogenase [Nocardia thailandica]